MHFIRSETSIPVPKVYCAFERKGITYIVMSRINGSPIGCNWRNRSSESKARLLEQLRRYIQEMRALKPRTSHVEGPYGSQLHDLRIPGGVRGFGPFDSVQAFHRFITDGVQKSPNQFSDVNDLITMYEDLQFTIHFTHGDLSSSNILVNEDEVVGIVDWDTSGWYPHYWEYSTAWNVNPYNEFWRDEVGKFLQEYPEELKMDNIRRKYFSDF